MTGGMGSYSPLKDVNAPLLDEITRTILKPTIDGLAAEGIEYRGALYAGLKLTAEGPKVLEFNCRFGDPETQAMLPRFEGDLFELLMASVDGMLASFKNYRWIPESCVCVVMASAGYPGKPETGKVITGLNEVAKMDKVVLFHAGTAKRGNQLVTSGGRVLGVTAIGYTLEEAANRSYRAVEQIHFDGAWYLGDIGRDTL